MHQPRRFEVQLSPISVTLKNGAPLHLTPAEALAMVGPHIDVVISGLPVPPQQVGAPGVTGRAIIDTGAAFTGVDESVCKGLGLAPSSKTRICHTGGSSDRYCYPVSLLFPNTGIPIINEVRAISVDLADGNQPPIAILGRDLLAKMKFTYDGPQGRFWFVYDEKDPPTRIVSPGTMCSDGGGI